MLKHQTWLGLALSLYFLGSGFYMMAKASLAQLLLESTWQQTSTQNSIDSTPPWPWADFYPVAKLTFVGLDLSYVVLNSDSGQALAFGPGLTGKSAVSDSDVTIISAHNDTHFKVLEKLNVGDKLALEVKHKLIQHYQVENIQVIDTQHEILSLEKNDVINQGVVLVTCYPFGGVISSTPYRYVVQARPISTANYTIEEVRNL